MSARDSPDLADLHARLVVLDAWIARPPPPDPYADGLAGDRERAVESAARRQEHADLVAQLADGTAKRAADIRAISADARRLGLDDGTLQSMIARITGGRTASRGHLTRPERGQLLRELGGRKRGGRGAPDLGRGPKAAVRDRATMLKRVEQLLRDLGLPFAYAEAILRRQRAIKDTAVACPLTAASDPELRGVIAALYRKGNPGAPHRGGAA